MNRRLHSRLIPVFLLTPLLLVGCESQAPQGVPPPPKEQATPSAPAPNPPAPAEPVAPTYPPSGSEGEARP